MYLQKVSDPTVKPVFKGHLNNKKTPSHQGTISQTGVQIFLKDLPQGLSDTGHLGTLSRGYQGIP